MEKVFLYDTTLRDGSQAEEIAFTAEDKLKIALKLDELGLDYIEGGFPASNPTDKAFFKEAKNYVFKHAKTAAFGSTHHPSHSAHADPGIKALAESGASVATIFGKTWTDHVVQALRIDLARNLEIVHDSVAELKSKLREVVFDAEHFFDGFAADPDYALAVLKKAHEAKADVLCLCDTNGGTLPHDVAEVVTRVVKAFPKTVIGIHCHNDSETAVANSLEAVRVGARHVQGTINGYGERCGNANLSSIIPVLKLKMGFECLAPHTLEHLTLASSYVAEVANVALFARQPFVGRSAFAHKGGIHVSAVNRNAALYEHIDPDLVGNKQRIILSELAGRANIVNLAGRYGFHLEKDEPVVKGLLVELKKKAAFGYDYAAAEGSVELLVLRKLARKGVREFFRILKYHVLDTKSCDGEPLSEAAVMVEVEGQVEHTAADGQGPVNALDNAVRKALKAFYPRLDEMKLIDFKVRVLKAAERTGQGTESLVRVLIESGDADARWTTVGVSHNIIDASRQALEDSITYKLYKDEDRRRKAD